MNVQNLLQVTNDSWLVTKDNRQWFCKCIKNLQKEYWERGGCARCHRRHYYRPQFHSVGDTKHESSDTKDHSDCSSCEDTDLEMHSHCKVGEKCFCADSSHWPMMSPQTETKPSLPAFLKYVPSLKLSVLDYLNSGATLCYVKWSSITLFYEIISRKWMHCTCW